MGLVWENEVFEGFETLFDGESGGVEDDGVEVGELERGGFFEAAVDVGAEDVAAFSLAVFADGIFCLEGDDDDVVVVFGGEFYEAGDDGWLVGRVDEEGAFGEDGFLGGDVVFGGGDEVFETDLAVDGAGGAEIHRERI